jgi:hypothetical protein
MKIRIFTNPFDDFLRKIKGKERRRRAKKRAARRALPQRRSCAIFLSAHRASWAFFCPQVPLIYADSPKKIG